MTFQGSSERVEIDSDCYHVNTIVVNNVMDVSCIQRGGRRIPTPPPIDIIREYEEGQRLDPACPTDPRHTGIRTHGDRDPRLQPCH